MLSAKVWESFNVSVLSTLYIKATKALLQAAKRYLSANLIVSANSSSILRMMVVFWVSNIFLMKPIKSHLILMSYRQTVLTS